MSPNEKSQQSTPAWLVREADRERYAKEVKAARKEQGLSQDELAEMSGVSRNTISNIERGKSLPHASNLLPLLRFLGIGPAAPRELRPVVADQLHLIGSLLELLPDAEVPVVGQAVTQLILDEVHRVKLEDNVVPMRPWGNAPTYNPNDKPDFSELDAASHGEKQTIPENGLESP